MRGTSYSVDAQVKILRAVAGDLAFDPGLGVEPGSLLLDTRESNPGLLGIDVQLSLENPAGRFKLEFAPAALVDNRLLVEFIAPYSLVAIALHRRGPATDRATTPAAEPVMLGLVDTVDIAEDYTQPAPSRRQSITGRSLAGILMDHRWYLHRWAQLQNVPADFRQFYAQPPKLPEAARDEIALQLLGAFAIDEDLFQKSPVQHPIDVLARVYDFYVRGTPSTAGGERKPFIRVAFADGSPLARRLRFDPAVGKASFVDSRAMLDVAVLQTQFIQASCWDMLRYLSPRYVNELFAIVRGDTVEDCYVELVARKPPWAGELSYEGPRAPLVAFPGGSEPAMYGQSLFDSERRGGWWGAVNETQYIDGSDILSTPQLQRGVDAGGSVFTLYEVLPLLASAAGNKEDDSVRQALWPPLVDIDPGSPGFVARYGVRPLLHRLQYVAGLGSDGDTLRQQDLLAQHAGAYQALLYTWFKRQADMWRGTYVLKGRTAFRPGGRMVDMSRSPRREYYVTGVRHHVAFGPGAEGTSFTTTVQVERGWDLSPGAA